MRQSEKRLVRQSEKRLVRQSEKRLVRQLILLMVQMSGEGFTRP